MKKSNLVEGKEQDLDPVEQAQNEIDEKNEREKQNKSWQPVENLSFMEYLPALDKYRCTEHDNKEFSSIITAKRHVSSSFHGLNWDGTEKKSSDDDPKDEIGNNEKAILEAMGETVPEKENNEIGGDAFEIHKAEKAKAIARVMENPYVTMFFVESRALKIFPPTFDEGDVIREALDYYGKALGFSINIGYNPKLITDPNLREKVKYSARAWDEFDGEDDA